MNGLVGMTLLHDGTGTTPYYSDTFPRGGLAAVFSLDVTHEAGAPTLQVAIEHKNKSDSAFTTAAGFANITGTGVFSKDITGIKELCRWAFVFGAGSAGEFFHVVEGAIAWRPY